MVRSAQGVLLYPEHSLTLAQLIHETGIALIGRVISREYGFSPPMFGPATLVTIEISEVLNDPKKDAPEMGNHLVR